MEKVVNNRTILSNELLDEDTFLVVSKTEIKV